ncbi:MULTISPECIES: hypothetical protein [Mycobacteriaceae]|uniref:Uncharacterized protein n=1 Tax=Mycolicibacterium neoaurum VKM Ac-1815D TaxID=700508 RepID=V5XJ50_MYCNE|nr:MULTISPECIES: hypothetical protein [Mycobacteriaceae]AXK77477.1 hypothetical protein DXK33_22635 [Mycolicibacterium neoaurum]KUM08729.1 hypothetical protein AVZ31_10225 [Mycolicibacterium neoaurum]
MTDDQVRTATRRVGGLFLAATMVMLRLERTLHATGGPGIIAFELAGSQDRATSIMKSWGPKGIAAARASLWLDFGYMATYGMFAALLAERADRRFGRRRSGVTLFPWAQIACAVAVAADAREGVALLNVLRGRDQEAQAVSARRAALTKFVLLCSVLLYWASSYGRFVGRSPSVQPVDGSAVPTA